MGFNALPRSNPQNMNAKQDKKKGADVGSVHDPFESAPGIWGD